MKKKKDYHTDLWTRRPRNRQTTSAREASSIIYPSHHLPLCLHSPPSGLPICFSVLYNTHLLVIKRRLSGPHLWCKLCHDKCVYLLCVSNVICIKTCISTDKSLWFWFDSVSFDDLQEYKSNVQQFLCNSSLLNKLSLSALLEHLKV